MDLKPFRSYDEHDVINLYSTMEGYLQKGSVVQYVPGVASPDNQNSFGVALSNVPSYAYSNDYVVNWKVTAATSGSKTIAGILLKEVVTNINDPWTVDARFVDPAKLAEQQRIPSGRAVPFATYGTFEVTGLDTSAGYADAGSGLVISNSGGGILAVASASTSAGRLGTVLSQSGSNGGVIIKFGPLI